MLLFNGNNIVNTSEPEIKAQKYENTRQIFFKKKDDAILDQQPDH